MPLSLLLFNDLRGVIDSANQQQEIICGGELLNTLGIDRWWKEAAVIDDDALPCFSAIELRFNRHIKQHRHVLLAAVGRTESLYIRHG